MISDMTKETLNITCNYLIQNYSKETFKKLLEEILIITGIESFEYITNDDINSYETIQNMLSSLNENEKSRKKNGVYYTPFLSYDSGDTF